MAQLYVLMRSRNCHRRRRREGRKPVNAKLDSYKLHSSCLCERSLSVVCESTW